MNFLLITKKKKLMIFIMYFFFNFMFYILNSKVIYFFLLSFRSEVSFGVDSRHNMGKQAHLHVVAKNLYCQDGNRTPVTYGVLDKRMVSI